MERASSRRRRHPLAFPENVHAFQQKQCGKYPWCSQCQSKNDDLGGVACIPLSGATPKPIFNTPAAALTTTGSPAWSMYIADNSDLGSKPAHTLVGLNESLDVVDGTPWGESSHFEQLEVVAVSERGPEWSTDVKRLHCSYAGAPEWMPFSLIKTTAQGGHGIASRKRSEFQQEIMSGFAAVVLGNFNVPGNGCAFWG
jgi:hypothetical protein